MTECLVATESPSTMIPKTKIELLKTMLLSRFGDLREQSLIRQGKGWFHVAGMGHEGMAALASSLEANDYCFPYYRDRALVLAKEYDSYEIALSFYAKRGATAAGRQLTGHYSSKKRNVWSLASPVAAHLLPAAGTAWGLQMDQKRNVVIATVGEASTRQGDFYEAVCFAKEHNLPVIFVVEDGRVSISTETKTMNPLLSLDVFNREDWEIIDGCNVNDVHKAGVKAVEKARNGEGPSFLWCNVERLSSHSSADDHRNYRSKEELSNIETNDPIVRFKRQLVQEGIISEEEIEAIEAQLKQRVQDEYKRAEMAQDPIAGEEMLQVTDGTGTPKPVTHLQAGEKYRMADTVNETFKHALRTNPNTLFFGEDIEDPLGGVFKLTKGLSTEFPTRVFNSPLAESTILGIACGLASYGKFPIFELQFVDFIFPGWNQLINNLANLRWRSNGDWSCPCIIYAPYGGYLPAGGIWHSQAQEAAFAHFPGMHVVIPSTPEDAAGLITTAMTCKDPVVILLPKHLLWASRIRPEGYPPIAIGKASIRQQGSAVTLVTWGNGVEITEQALKECPFGSDVEFIDLRSVVPWDKEAILKSVRKTGRLVILQEDSENCSVGQMIISTVLADAETFAACVAQPILVTKGNVCIGFNPIYEYSALPSKEDLLEALNTSYNTQTTRKEAAEPLTLEAAPTQEGATNSPAVSAQTSAETILVKVPNLGEGLREARVMHLFKKPGDRIEADDPLCEVETDKAIFPIEASNAGTFGEWLVQEDEMVDVGQLIANITPDPSTELMQEPVPMPTLDKSQNNKALSAEILKQMQGVLPASLTVNASIEQVKGARKGRNRLITSSIMVAWEVTRALEANAPFCRLLRGADVSDVQEVFDIGIAVALENDVLETAIIPQANSLNWVDFVAAYKKAIKDCKNGVRVPKTRSPIIISSMSSYHIRMGSPIVVPPAMTVLFVGDSFYEHIATPEGPKLQESVSLCITFDHRWVNGAGGARFLNDIKKNVESFEIPA